MVCDLQEVEIVFFFPFFLFTLKHFVYLSGLKKPREKNKK